MGSRRTMLLLLAAAVAVVVAVMARGGDDGGEPVTRAQLVARANEVCARLGRANAALRSPPKPYDMQSEAFFAGVGDNVRVALDALDALDPPSEEDGALGRLVDGYEEVGVQLEKIQAAAAVEQDQEIVVILGEIERLVPGIVESERELGVCAGDASAQATIAAQIRRTRPNPLTETGPLLD